MVSKSKSMLCLLVPLAIACAAEPTPAAKVAPLLAKGALDTSFGGGAVHIDYTGRPVTLNMVHRQNLDAKGVACIVQLDLSVAMADGSCQLDLQWRPGSGGLQLQTARFMAVKAISQDGTIIDTLPCAGWPDPAKHEVLFEGGSDDATLSLPYLTQPAAGQATAKLGLNLAMTGTAKLKAGGKLFSFDLKNLTFAGDGSSKGRTDVSCGKSTAATGTAQCAKSPQPGSVVGTDLRRPVLYRCSDDSLFDIGELCGASAIWVTQHHDWVSNTELSKQVPTVWTTFKDQGVAAVFIVAEGAKQIEHDNKGNPTANLPTAEECLAIAEKFKIPQGVELVYDKDAKLLIDGSTLAGGWTKDGKPTVYVPFMVFARADGRITGILPDAEGKSASGAVQAGVQAAIDAE